MKAVMYSYAVSIKNLPDWWRHNEVKEDLTPDQIMELYNTGNDVMLRHHKEGMLVCVDNQGFHQR
jgi:hypothetical protein